MRPLKIALVAHSYWEENRRHTHDYDNQEGGDMQQLAEAVAALGHEVVVFSASPEVGKLRAAKVGELECWLLPRERHRGLLAALRDWSVKKTYSHHKAYSDATYFREFLFKRGPFDVIWTHSEAPDGLIVAMAAHLGAKLPPVLVQVQSLRQRFEKNAPVFTERVPLGLAFRRAARILVGSELVAKSIVRYAGSGLKPADLQAKVHVMHPNLQRAFLRAAEEDPDDPPSMRDRVLFVGQLNQVSGATVFLKAIPKTEAAQRISTFAIIGDFTEKNTRFVRRWEEMREEVRVRITGARVEFLGRVSSYEVMRQIKLARVVVIPALFNPFSRGVIEALVLGRAVITTDQVGAAPFVESHECGLVVPPHNSSALAKAIDIVLDDASPHAANARRLSRRLLHEFSSEAVALQVSHHLSEIAGPPKDPKIST